MSANEFNYVAFEKLIWELGSTIPYIYIELLCRERLRLRDALFRKSFSDGVVTHRSPCKIQKAYCEVKWLNSIPA